MAFRTRVALALGILTALWMAYARLSSMASITMEGRTIQRMPKAVASAPYLGNSPVFRAEPITIPFSRDNDPTPQIYLIHGELTRGRLAAGAIRIVGDDCVNELTIDGKTVNLAGIPRTQRCDWQRGFVLDLSPYLPAGGTAPFTLTLENLSGPYGLTAYSLGRVMPTILGILGLTLLFFTFQLMLSVSPLGPHPLAALLLAIATALRYDVIFRLHPAVEHAFSDANNYFQHGLAIARGYFWIGQTFQGIGYPVLLGAAFRLGGPGNYSVAYGMQLVAAVLTVVVSWRATARLLGERLGLWALLILAFHYPFIGMAGFFMAETLYGLGISVLFYLLARFAFPWSWPVAFAIGAVHMASGTFKGLNGFFPPLLLVWGIGHAVRLGLFTGARRDPRLIWRRILGPFVAFAIGVTAVALPQGLLTKAYYGTFQLSAPTGALNLVEGKCPEKLNVDSTGAHWLSPLFAQLGEKKEKHWPRPFTDQGFFWRAGLDCIAANPGVLLTSLRYDYFLFFGNELWPPNMTLFREVNRRYALLFGLLMIPGIAIGLGLVARAPFSTRILPYLPAFSILFCAWALKSEMRYRIPFDSVFIAAGLAGWTWIFERTGLAERSPPGAEVVAFAATALGLGLLVALPIVVIG